MSQKFRKVLIPQYGDPSVLRIVEDTIAPPPAGHVQVAPIYAGFSGADVNMRRGTYPNQRSAPLTPGYCHVGTVRAAGTGASKFKPGDLVACLTTYDSQAELVNIPEKHAVPVPSGLDLRQVTALVLDWCTAYAMVHQVAKVTKGQRIFIHGISGSVGYAAMKLSQRLGAQVYGTASPRNHDAVRADGATPFTYADKVWMDEMKALGGAHAVFDSIGFESLDESYDILTDHGIVVAFGANKQSYSGEAPTSPVWSVVKFLAKGKIPWRGKRTAFYIISRDQPDYQPNLRALLDLLSRGEITVPIRKTWAMDDIQEAHRNWSSGNGIGAVVVSVSPTAE